PRTAGAIPLPRRRTTPTLVADHGRRVEPRPVSMVGRTGQAEEAARPGAPGTPAPGPGGLPRRVRQANLAPQLKNTPAAAPADSTANPVTDRDAEDVRTRMSALQRGWTAGRNQHAPQQSEAEAGTPAAPGRGSENEGDGR
ncbi:histidine kinase, partial [Streptomyces sp. NPDC054838]